jgi:uncharacterized protein (DUF58 family)
VAKTKEPRRRGSKYLKLSDLRRLEHLMFAPRRLVEGRYSGQYTTRQRGQSVEFYDYREYLAGDDVGHIDWKLFGRSDRLYIKLFEHQSELTVHLLVDASASMDYRGQTTGASQGGMSKYDYACSLAAAISFLVLKQHDRFGLAFSCEGLNQPLVTDGSMRHLTRILAQMEQTKPRGHAHLAEAIGALTRTSTRRSLLIVFSDLWDDADETAAALAARSATGGESIVFHVLHPDELNLPDCEHGLFIDSETEARLRLNVHDIRATYQARVQEHLAVWAGRCRGLGVDYVRSVMSQPYYTVLEHYAAIRASRKSRV